jgi:hypothetical protein
MGPPAPAQAAHAAFKASGGTLQAIREARPCIEADGEIFGDRSLMPNAEHPIEHRLGWFWAMGFTFALGRHGESGDCIAR